MRRKRQGLACWPGDYASFEAGEDAVFHGHLTADECRSWWGDEDDSLTTGTEVRHVYARSIPVRDQDWSTEVRWPYSPGPGAYPCTIVTLIHAPGPAATEPSRAAPEPSAPRLAWVDNPGDGVWRARKCLDCGAQSAFEPNASIHHRTDCKSSR